MRNQKMFRTVEEEGGPGTVEGLGPFDKLFVKNTRKRGLAGKRFFS